MLLTLLRHLMMVSIDLLIQLFGYVLEILNLNLFLGLKYLSPSVS